ncbi:hypothetical protein GWK08_05305 [Leptobacterium flavescens]|uniref:Uncharacterized protein n=1 Tax=Leptobacterium flavescens TaxID=472055 RepID=A0A6P0UIN1_9FLAO|nr:hypothetical protein [Leptobacterium flavescens]NER12847.1 hypothetical protein [Leptobacterium flavescens]
MQVRCLIDRIDPKVHDEWLFKWANSNKQLEITKGKTYVVMAISKYSNNYFYYLLGDESSDYPLAFPKVLFEIVNNKISKYWDCNLEFVNSISELDIKDQDVCSFIEWKNLKDLFYENLLEEDKQTVKVFESYKNKMLLEAELDNFDIELK